MFPIQNSSSATLELDLEHYVVPAPSTSANSGLVYAANMTETPRSLSRAGVFSNADSSGSVSHSGISVDRPATIKVILVTDLVIWNIVSLRGLEKHFKS